MEGDGDGWGWKYFYFICFIKIIIIIEIKFVIVMNECIMWINLKKLKKNFKNKMNWREYLFWVYLLIMLINKFIIF